MIEFKDDKARSTYPQCKETLKDALYECSKWCDQKGVPFVITRAVDGPIEGITKSKTHEEGRACDISIKGWSSCEIDEFIFDMNKKFADSIGAVSASDGKARFIVFHVGTAPHFHAQCRQL